MSRQYEPPKCKYRVENGHIVSEGDVRNKMSGTAIGAILGVSPWSTPFQAACNLLGLGREDISGKPAVKTGIALEDRIIRYADSTYSSKGTFLAAEEVYEKRAGDHDSWVSDFQDDYFAGHVDGIVVSPDGEDYILEVKTTGNPEGWVESVPIQYYWQVALYNEFITQKDKAYVVLGIVNNNTYRDPESWVPNINTVGLFEMAIDMEDVREKMQIAREWYDKYIMNGVTPDYDPDNEGDVELYEHLKALTADIDEVQELMDQYWDAETKVNEALVAVENYTTFKEDVKSKLKDYMVAHNLSSLPSKNGQCRGVLGTQSRKSYDMAKMAKAGIDIESYAKTTNVKTFTIRSNNKEQ